MKTITIGDTHGRSTWKEIVQKELLTADKIIFLGDYFDTHDLISPREQIDNFKEIITLKKTHPDTIILLFGNHDWHYLRTSNQRFSGYQNLFALDIQEVLHDALDESLLQMCYIQNNYVFTHAGLSKTWCKKHLGNDSFSDGIVLEQVVNDIFKFQPNQFAFSPGERMDNYGNEPTQGPIWIRPESLAMDKLDGFKFVVGHTQVPTLRLNKGGIFKDIIQVDCLGYVNEYLIIENGEELVGTF